MARLRRWGKYKILEVPYTRVSRSKKKNYIPGAKPTLVRLFHMGNLQKNPNEWRFEASLIAKESHQIRDNAIEALRIMLNKYLEASLGKSKYLFIIRKYPHHIWRENPMATGAGADRISQGMRLSFGKPKGRAVQIHEGEKLLSIFFDDESKAKEVKEYLRIARSKLPWRYTELIFDNQTKRPLNV